ncbi:MAG: MFS transporter [Acidiferrobacterales bacterium]
MRAGVVFPTASMLAVLMTASMGSFAVAVVAAEAAPAIGIDATYVGFYTSIVFIVAMFSGMGSEAFIHRFGAIRVCQGSMLFAAVSMGIMALGYPWAALLSAALLGMAHGPFNPASAHVLVNVASPRWRPLIFSIKQTGVPVGGMLAGGLIPVLTLALGWRGAVLVVTGIALAVLITLQPLRRTFDANRKRGEPLSRISITSPLRLVITHPALRGLALVAFAYAGCQSSVGAFFVLYMVQVADMPLVQAGLVFALLQTGGGCGRISWGAIAGRFVSSRKLLAALGMATATLIAVMLVLTSRSPPAVIAALGFIMGASSFGWNGVFLAEVAARAPEGKIGEATAGVQFVMFGGIVIMPPLFAVVVNVAQSYAAAFSIAAGAALVAGIYLATWFGRALGSERKGSLR